MPKEMTLIIEQTPFGAVVVLLNYGRKITKALSGIVFLN